MRITGQTETSNLNFRQLLFSFNSGLDKKVTPQSLPTPGVKMGTTELLGKSRTRATGDPLCRSLTQLHTSHRTPTRPELNPVSHKPQETHTARAEPGFTQATGNPHSWSLTRFHTSHRIPTQLELNPVSHKPQDTHTAGA